MAGYLKSTAVRLRKPPMPALKKSPIDFIILANLWATNSFQRLTQKLKTLEIIYPMHFLAM
jgi:hypothetical protein